MPQIVPIRDLKNTNDIYELVNNTDGPVFVTKNGYGALVMMSMKSYDENMRRLETRRLLAEAEAEYERGEMLDGEKVMAELEKKYG